MVDLQQPYKIRHHPNDVFSFTHNLTEGWHAVTNRGLSQHLFQIVLYAINV